MPRLVPVMLQPLRLGELVDPQMLPTTKANQARAGKTAMTIVGGMMTVDAMSQGDPAEMTTETETATATATGTGGQTTEETDRPTARDTETTGGEITHRGGVTMIGEMEVDMTDMRMTGAGGHALVSIAANDRRRVRRTGPTRGGGWKRSPHW